jgi:hypothetical protein
MVWLYWVQGGVLFGARGEGLSDQHPGGRAAVGGVLVFIKRFRGMREEEGGAAAVVGERGRCHESIHFGSHYNGMLHGCAHLKEALPFRPPPLPPISQPHLSRCTSTPLPPSIPIPLMFLRCLRFAELFLQC